MKQFRLTIASRSGIGRGASRRVRHAGRIPAVLYGKLNPPQALSIDAPEFTRLMKTIAGSAAIIEIKEGENENRLSIIQEVQRDPISDRVLHVDLHEISANDELELDVTVHATGDCVGVRVENGILETVKHELRIRCLPKDLPSFIEIDVTNLHVDEAIHVRDIPAIPGVVFVDDPGQSVIACVEPVVEVEPTPVAEAAGATAEAGAAPAAGGAAAPAAGAAAAPAAETKSAGKK